MNRFIPKRIRDVYYVADRQFKHVFVGNVYPENMAVCLFFEHEQSAQDICDVMNKEWGQFVRNPE